MGKIKFVVKRGGATVPFNAERITNAIYRAAVAVGGRDKELSKKLGNLVIEHLEKQFPKNKIPNVEDIQDIVEKVLIENGHSKVAKEYILYRNESNKRRAKQLEDDSKFSANIPWAKIWHILDWSVSKGLHYISKLNEKIRANKFEEIVQVSEAAYEKDLDIAANLIIKEAKNLKMVFVSGPSSSGKTTTTIKLEQRLKSRGLKFVTLNVDNYFLDLEMHPKDEFGDYDFETPQALDLELINSHLIELSLGKEILVPFYNFKSGKRKLNQTPLKLNTNEILLIDSLHGLFPKMSEGIEENKKFKIYIEPLLQMKDVNDKYIRWTDLRLIRRMLRDSVFRAYNPQQTLEHWHYVRASELRHIIPFWKNANYIINSAMPYEIALYCPPLLKYFQEWQEKYKRESLREDAFIRATRIYDLLNSVEPVEDNSPVPLDSVLREFIGGSINKY